MKSDIDHITMRTRQYWHVDGVAELGFSITSILLGIYFYGLSSLPADSLFSQVLNLSMIVFFVSLTFAGKRLVSIIKDRITYPRTGYLAYPRPTRRKNFLTAVLAVLMAALVAVLFVTSPVSLDWLPAVTGVLIGAGVLVYASRLGILRFYLFAAASVLIGVGLSFVGAGNLRGLAFYYFLAGILALISGSLVLRKYLRSASPAEENIDGA